MRNLLAVAAILLAFALGAGLVWHLSHREGRLPDAPALVLKIREVARLETLDVSLYKKIDFSPDPREQATVWASLAQWASYTVRPPRGRAIVFAVAHLGLDLRKLDTDSLRVTGRRVEVVLPRVQTEVELRPAEVEIIGSNLNSEQTAQLFERARNAFEAEVVADKLLQERARESARQSLRSLCVGLGFSEVAFVEKLSPEPQRGGPRSPLDPRSADRFPQPRLLRRLPAPGARGAGRAARADGTTTAAIPRARPGGFARRRPGGIGGIHRRPSGGSRVRPQADHRGEHGHPFARLAAGRRAAHDRPRLQRLPQCPALAREAWREGRRCRGALAHRRPPASLRRGPRRRDTAHAAGAARPRQQPDGAHLSGRGDGRPPERARDRHDHRRRPRSRNAPAQHARDRGGILHRQLSQVAVRAEGSGLPARPPRPAGANPFTGDQPWGERAAHGSVALPAGVRLDGDGRPDAVSLHPACPALPRLPVAGRVVPADGAQPRAGGARARAALQRPSGPGACSGRDARLARVGSVAGRYRRPAADPRRRPLASAAARAAGEASHPGAGDPLSGVAQAARPDCRAGVQLGRPVRAARRCATDRAPARVGPGACQRRETGGCPPIRAWRRAPAAGSRGDPLPSAPPATLPPPSGRDRAATARRGAGETRPPAAPRRRDRRWHRSGRRSGGRRPRTACPRRRRRRAGSETRASPRRARRAGVE